MTDSSGPLRRSIEVEYWVVDEDGRLTGPGKLVDLPGAEREFVEPVLEVKTTPCESTAELREELFERVGRAVERAEDCGLGLVPLATPLCAAEIEELPDERTRVQNRVVGDRFEHVRHCAGTHIHVEQRPGRVTDQYNTLVALDPALALVNSAPHFRGELVAAGARSELYRRRAYADLPHQGRLWSYIDSVGEWERRLERRYEEFTTAARRAGVTRQTVAANFDAESAVWTPVQLRDRFGTVEWRSPDTALPSRVVRLADHLATLMEGLEEREVTIEGTEGSVGEETVVLPTFDAVLEYVEAAIDEGLASQRVRSYLGRMGFEANQFEPVTHELAGWGELTTHSAARLRLEHAERLRRDVGRQRAVEGN